MELSARNKLAMLMQEVTSSVNAVFSLASFFFVLRGLRSSLNRSLVQSTNPIRLGGIVMMSPTYYYYGSLNTRYSLLIMS